MFLLKMIEAYNKPANIIGFTAFVKDKHLKPRLQAVVRVCDLATAAI